jgi:two-component system phosphate regulon response regulator OmpR
MLEAHSHRTVTFENSMNTRSPLIFLVDDDAELREMVGNYLVKNGLEVIGMSTGDEMLRRIQRLRPDLVVLDLMMPGSSGLETCRRLRVERDDVPIIMLTARSDLVDRVIGLESGADDYLGKPFDPRELLARIHAVLRRRPIPALPGQAQSVQMGAWVFSPASRTLQRGDEVQALSDAEHALLRAMTERPGQPLSRERLLEAMHGRHPEIQDRSVDVAIHRLRRLVEPNIDAPRYIQTMRGCGYVFVPDADKGGAR